MSFLVVSFLCFLSPSILFADGQLDLEKISQSSGTLKDKVKQLNGKDRQKIQNLLSSVELVLVDPVQGKFGIKIKEVAAFPQLVKVGIKANDVITGLDGVGLTVSSGSLALFEKLKKQKEFLIEVRRNGVIKNIKVLFK